MLPYDPMGVIVGAILGGLVVAQVYHIRENYRYYRKGDE